MSTDRQFQRFYDAAVEARRRFEAAARLDLGVDEGDFPLMPPEDDMPAPEMLSPPPEELACGYCQAPIDDFKMAHISWLEDAPTSGRPGMRRRFRIVHASCLPDDTMGYTVQFRHLEEYMAQPKRVARLIDAWTRGTTPSEYCLEGLEEVGVIEQLLGHVPVELARRIYRAQCR